MKARETVSPACPFCGGKKGPGKTTFTADLGDGLVVVRGVDCTVCLRCGEEWISDDTARRLEQLVEKARHERRQVEILDYASVA